MDMTEAADESGRQDRPAGPRLRVFHDTVARIQREETLDEPVRTVTRRLAPLGHGSLGRVLGGDWLGHSVHPLLTDLPLGCWMTASFLDVIGGRAARPAARRLVGIGVIGAVPTVATGWSEFLKVGTPELRRVGLVHGVGNVAAVAVYLSSYRQRRRGHHWRGVLLGAVGAAMTSFTGYLGGYLLSGRGAGVGMRGIAPGASAGHAADDSVTPSEPSVSAGT